MRRVIAFPCGGDTLIGSLDAASGSTGLVIVSGGNEVRVGAHRGMAQLAADVAAAGYPVFRFDRRGIGDSTGTNHGFLSSADDLAAAVAGFRREAPQIDHIVAFGNCDAASTLALFGRAAGIERVLLANPWIVEESDDLPPDAAIRARYAARLRSPAAWLRLARGGVDLAKLARGIAKLARRTPSDPDGLAARVLAAIDRWGDDASIILARGDATAIAYRAAASLSTTRTVTLDTDSHSFAREADRTALRDAVIDALRR